MTDIGYVKLGLGTADAFFFLIMLTIIWSHPRIKGFFRLICILILIGVIGFALSFGYYGGRGYAANEDDLVEGQQYNVCPVDSPSTLYHSSVCMWPQPGGYLRYYNLPQTQFVYGRYVCINENGKLKLVLIQANTNAHP